MVLIHISQRFFLCLTVRQNYTNSIQQIEFTLVYVIYTIQFVWLLEMEPMSRMHSEANVPYNGIRLP